MRLVITHWALARLHWTVGHWTLDTGQWDTSLHCLVRQGFPSFSVSRTLIWKGLSRVRYCNLFVDIKGDISLSYLVIVIVQDTVFS